MKIKNSLFRPILEFRAKRHGHLVENNNINSNTVLIVAILFLGDLFMLAPFIAALKKFKPDVEVILVCRDDLKELASLLKVKHIVPSTNPTRSAIKRIRELSDGGLVAAYCIFSGRWLPAMIDIEVKKVVSFRDPSGRWDHLITEKLDLPKGAMPAIKIPLLMLDNNHPDEDLIMLDSWKPVGEKAIIHVGARSILRRMPIWLITYIVNILNNKAINIIITAGPNEFNDLNKLRKLIPANVFNRIDFELGSKKMHELVPTIISSNIVIGIDTGFLHLTKALGIPTLVLLGPSQEEIYGGDNCYSRSIHLEISNLTCRDKKTFHGLKEDWINNCNRDDCHVEGMPCIGNLDVELIGDSIDKLLDLSLKTKSSISIKHSSH